MREQPNREPGSSGEVAVIVGGGGLLAVGFATWLGAWLAALLVGGHVAGGLDICLRAAVRLAQGRPPAVAWGVHATRLPAAWLYWTCTAIAFVVVGGVCGLLVWGWRRLDPNRGKRQRFGQPSETHEATAKDVVPLIIGDIVPPAGKMLLGRMANHRTLLATEDRERHPLTGRAKRRQGHRGSVAVIGPTGSGKTALLIAAIATWDGPVVAVSVKRDLYNHTANIRATKGELAVFDPAAATNLATARWTPLGHVTTVSGALRAGRALAQAIPHEGVTNATFWEKHGERLLGAFICLAGLSRLLPGKDGKPRKIVTVQQLASWVTSVAMNSDPDINELIATGLRERKNIEVMLMAKHAAEAFDGIAKEDRKIRSSIYTTAALGLDPWREPSVAHSATDSARPFYNSTTGYKTIPRFIDLEWLMEGDQGRGNTLYLTAAEGEFQRLSPVLGGLLADLKDTIHAWDIAGRKLEKPVLFVIDEAGQLQLDWLPVEVSTIAALGGFFVTCWQSVSQVQHRYRTLADTVLSGHRTKCFFAGINDPTTANYLIDMLGNEYVTRWTTSHDRPGLFTGQAARQTVSQSTERQPFLAANTLREMYPGEAVLIHGTLPPIHMQAIQWWDEPEFKDLDAGGSSDVRSTCPLGCAAATSLPSIVEPDTMKAELARLPEPIRRPP